MSLISTYEQQYGNLTAEITSKINQIHHLSSPNDRSSAVNNVDKLFVDAREILEQIELETRSQPPSLRQKYTTRLQSYQTEQRKLEQDFRKAKLASQSASDRDDLFEFGDGVTSDNRQLLLDNTERLERTGNRLNDGVRSVEESQRVGQEILSDLGAQRETLQKGRDRLKAANQDLGASSRVLSGMLRRIVQNRILLILIVAVMLIVIGMVIYVASRRGKAPSIVPNPPPASTASTKLPKSPTPVP